MHYTAFTYDPLNGIAQANTITTTGANCWSEVYTIDPWGNLTNRAAASGMAANCSTELLNDAPANTKNQLNGPLYDAAGNVTNDGNGNQPTYDAENKIATDAGVTYRYDADGVRMEKSSGTMYWSGASGALAETDLSGAINEEYVYFNGARIARVDRPNGTVHYYFSDQLGSANVVASPSGAVEEQDFYYPYGGLVATIGSNTNHYKFTGKERDTESGLDMFGARYYGSSLGRFMQVDPKQFSLRTLVNPQKWNKYAYVLNLPLSLVDPNGMEEITLVYRTFIQSSSVGALGQHFGGDSRGFSTAANASSRTSISVRIETDASKRPGNPIISVTAGAGESRKLDANGNVIKTATATTGLPTATGTRDASGNPVINIQQDVKNPLSPGPQFLTPGISANLTVTVPQDASSAHVTGDASNFPSEELNVTRQDGNTTPVMQFQPGADATPFSLFEPNRNVDEQKATPQCSTDDKGKKTCSQ